MTRLMTSACETTVLVLCALERAAVSGVDNSSVFEVTGVGIVLESTGVDILLLVAV